MIGKINGEFAMGPAVSTLFQATTILYGRHCHNSLLKKKLRCRSTEYPTQGSLSLEVVRILSLFHISFWKKIFVKTKQEVINGYLINMVD